MQKEIVEKLKDLQDETEFIIKNEEIKVIDCTNINTDTIMQEYYKSLVS